MLTSHMCWWKLTQPGSTKYHVGPIYGWQCHLCWSCNQTSYRQIFQSLKPDEFHPSLNKETYNWIMSHVSPSLPPVPLHGWNPQGVISLAIIHLIFKIDDSVSACNYHPVSLICVPCKLLQHMLCSNIMTQFDELKHVYDRQCAFGKRHIVKLSWLL